MKARQSNRAAFDSNKPIASADLRAILDAARWAPTPHNMQNFEIVVVDDRDMLATLGDLQVPTSFAFVRENCRQLSFSEDELRAKKVGLLGTSFPASWRDPKGLDFEAASREPNRRLGESLRGAPMLLVVVYDPSRGAPASDGDVLGMIGLGCVMENMWLAATSLSLGFQILSTFAGRPVESALHKLLHLPEGRRVAFAARLGHPIETLPYLRVRREIESFTHKNRFAELNSTGALDDEGKS
jgi:nitroreductase